MYLRADKRRGIVYAGPGLPTIRARIVAATEPNQIAQD